MLPVRNGTLWLYGKTITVHNDHQPLETIFRKPLAKAPKRLQRLIMHLQRYTLNVVYKKGTSLVLADTRSRSPLPSINTSKQTAFEIFRINLEESVEVGNPNLTPKTTAELQMATRHDPVISELACAIRYGWPANKTDLKQTLTPYWPFRDELSILDGIIYGGSQALIPPSMQKHMPKRIHASHLGADSNIRMCRDILFWPGMQAAVRELCSQCEKCAQYSKENRSEQMLSHPIPEYPWQYVSQDICTHDGKNYLVTVDHYSDFIEVDILENTLSATVVEKTRIQFCRHGILEILLTDNGPQFVSSDFETFCAQMGISHITSSPYWPKGNGKAEASVKIIKAMIKKSEDLQLALLMYRNTPNQGYTFSPVQRCMNRHTRTTIPIMKDLLKFSTSKLVQGEISAKRQKAQACYNKKIHGDLPDIPLGCYVYAKPAPQDRGRTWHFGKVTGSPSPRSYTIETATSKLRRNRKQLHLATPQVERNHSEADTNPKSDSSEHSNLYFDCDRPKGSMNTLGPNVIY